MPNGVEPLGVNARMYAITPRADEAWRAIFAWLERATGIPLSALDHPPPAPLADLWSRPRLGCVVMCGWPFIEASPRPHLLASPIPSPARFAGRPAYWSDLVVRADSRYRVLEDTFGGRVGWTVQDSHSGFNMFRHHLLAYRKGPTDRLYAGSVGGLINPLGALTAVADGIVDVAPVDSFCHDLLRSADLPVTRAIRTIGATAPSPMPVLIASADVSLREADTLSDALLSLHLDPEIATALRAALIDRFVLPEISDYEWPLLIDRAAKAAGYARPE